MTAVATFPTLAEILARPIGWLERAALTLDVHAVNVEAARAALHNAATRRA